MKKSFKIFIIVFLLCIFTYICKIDSISNNLIIYNGEELNIGNFIGLNLELKDTLLASNNLASTENSEENVNVKLFNLFNVKQITVNKLDEKTVIPVGEISGLKLYTNGVLVVGMSEIKAEDNQKYKPYETTQIEFTAVKTLIKLQK